MTTQPYSAPRAQQHFAGTLVEKDAGCTLGLCQLSLRFEDDDKGSHIVYIAHGRGADAQARLDAQYTDLQIGQRYHVAANMGCVGAVHTYWLGAVTIKADQRRARFAPNPAPNPAPKLQQVQP